MYTLQQDKAPREKKQHLKSQEQALTSSSELMEAASEELDEESPAHRAGSGVRQGAVVARGLLHPSVHPWAASPHCDQSERRQKARGGRQTETSLGKAPKPSNPGTCTAPRGSHCNSICKLLASPCCAGQQGRRIHSPPPPNLGIHPTAIHREPILCQRGESIPDLPGSCPSPGGCTEPWQPLTCCTSLIIRSKQWLVVTILGPDLGFGNMLSGAQFAACKGE